MKNYVCGICGTEHFNLDAYMKCVSKCGETLKAEQKAKEDLERLEKMNAALNRVKEAKKYFEEQLAKFEKEYPSEYQLNFGEKHKYPNLIKSNLVGYGRAGDAEFTYEQKGNGKPKITAKINGKEVDNEELKNDLLKNPETKYIAEMLGLI